MHIKSTYLFNFREQKSDQLCLLFFTDCCRRTITDYHKFTSAVEESTLESSGCPISLSIW